MNHPVRDPCPDCGKPGRFVGRGFDRGTAAAGMLVSGLAGIFEGIHHTARFRCTACGRAWGSRG